MIEAIFLESALKRFKEHKALGDKTLAQLNDAQLLHQPDAESNSIAMIIQHMHGNMLSRWTAFLTEDGEKPWRRRDEEFEPQTFSKAHAVQLWEDGWKVVLDTISGLTPADLSKNITIRTQPLNVVDAINRQLAHYSYHVGQIVFLGKWLVGADWQTLSIAKGASQQFNDKLKKKSH